MNDCEAKSRLRREALDRRASLAPAARAAFSARLKAEGLGLAARHDAETVSAFHPIRGEPDTLALLDAISRRGQTTALPITRGRGEPLLFRVWRPGDPTVIGQLGIPEPSPTALLAEPDMLFVPLAAFDRRGHRIGYGAGHYDRTLSLLRRKRRTIAVGVAYSLCEVDAIPDEPHDEALDYILTESELIKAVR